MSPIPTSITREVDLFDPVYRDRVRDAVWAAIVTASRDPATGLVPVRNYEIYDALLQVQAMILASSKQASSPTKTREIASELAKRLRTHVAAFRKAYERDGVPFDVLHTDDLN
jgi:hypothetical protein